MAAAAGPSLPVLAALMRNTANAIHERDRLGDGLLHYAVKAQQVSLEIVDFLARSLDVCASNNAGETPLSLSKGNVRELLQAKHQAAQKLANQNALTLLSQNKSKKPKNQSKKPQPQNQPVKAAKTEKPKPVQANKPKAKNENISTKIEHNESSEWITVSHRQKSEMKPSVEPVIESKVESKVESKIELKIESKDEIQRLVDAITSRSERAHDLALVPEHVLGLNLDELSMAQLAELEELHHSLLRQISERRLEMIRVQERLGIEEQLKLQRELEKYQT
jgi:hypothetical protein